MTIDLSLLPGFRAPPHEVLCHELTSYTFQESGVLSCETCDVTLTCDFTEPDPNSCCGVRCKGCTVDQIHYSSGATWSSDGCRQLCSCHGGIVTCIEMLVPQDYCLPDPVVSYLLFPLSQNYFRYWGHFSLQQENK